MRAVPKQVAATDGSSASTKAIARRRICSQSASASGGIAPSAKLPADAVLAPAACMRSHAAIVGSRIWPAGSSCPAAARHSHTSSAEPEISTSAVHRPEDGRHDEDGAAAADRLAGGGEELALGVVVVVEAHGLPTRIVADRHVLPRGAVEDSGGRRNWAWSSENASGSA